MVRLKKPAEQSNMAITCRVVQQASTPWLVLMLPLMLPINHPSRLESKTPPPPPPPAPEKAASEDLSLEVGLWCLQGA